MRRTTDDARDPAAAATLQRLAALLRRDDVDGAIAAGLMEFDAAAAAAEGPDLHHVLEAQRRLRRAWAARERYRARNARLARRAAQREAGGAMAPAAAGAEAVAAAAATDATPRESAPAASVPGAALPPAAQAALARATARARERNRG